MCGISGIFSTKSPENLSGAIKKMNDALAHRGKDNEGYFYNSNIAFGHKRLSIIDLSEAAAQPMQSNCKQYVIVYNGELYNYKELKQEIKYNYRTESDTEVVLAAYIQWGEKCVDKFNGMYAFAVWDKTQNSLFIARDRLGIKPLYYYYNGGLFVFASEIRSLLKSGLVANEININALSDYLRYQTIHQPQTIIQNIRLFPAGHIARVAANGFDLKPYWQLKNFKVNNSITDYQAVKKQTAGLLRSSVSHRLIADVPLATFLSGGIDSSIITALASETGSKPLNTFTVIFNEKHYNEQQFAEIVARKYNTNHTEIKLKADDLLHILPEALDALDTPGGDGQNSYIISKAIADEGIKVALSGLGGDELFAGYDIFKRLTKIEKNQRLTSVPKFAKRYAANIMKVLKPGTAAMKINLLLEQKKWDLKNTYPVMRMMFADKTIRKLLHKKKIDTNVVKQISENYNQYNISNISKCEINTYLQNVLLRDADNMSMAHGLELRVPFLDHRLVEFILQLPDKMKYPNTPKKLLVDSFKHTLPPEIINRPKMGFTLPWAHWLKNELYDFANEQIKNLAQREYFNNSAVWHIWKKFLTGNPEITWSRVWYLVVLEYWLNKNNL